MGVAGLVAAILAMVGLVSLIVAPWVGAAILTAAMVLAFAALAESIVHGDLDEEGLESRR